MIFSKLEGTPIMSKKRAYVVYQSLRKALERSGVLGGGATATLLFETFLEDSGRLLASKVISRGLCVEGEFGKWRRELIDRGWLVWSETQPDKGCYAPGKKLIYYINKEKLSQKEIVTRDQVLMKEEAATRDEVQDLKARMNRIEEVVNQLQIAVLPPDTDDKRMLRIEAAKQLAVLAKVN
jgi:hypothetical protein